MNESSKNELGVIGKTGEASITRESFLDGCEDICYNSNIKFTSSGNVKKS